MEKVEDYIFVLTLYLDDNVKAGRFVGTMYWLDIEMIEYCLNSSVFVRAEVAWPHGCLTFVKGTARPEFTSGVPISDFQ